MRTIIPKWISFRIQAGDEYVMIPTTAIPPAVLPAVAPGAIERPSDSAIG